MITRGMTYLDDLILCCNECQLVHNVAEINSDLGGFLHSQRETWNILNSFER